MENAGSLEYARAYATRIIEQAKKQLDATLDHSAPKQLLLSMADFFISREG
jgi:geranylgeranyl diphosphate synthase type I